MKDSELRGIVLKGYYFRRREGFAGLTVDDFGNQLSAKALFDICGQLSEFGLLKTCLVRGSATGTEPCEGMITAKGVEVIEGTTTPPTGVVIDRIEISGASRVQIGTGNSQVTNRNVTQTFHGNVGTVAGGNLTQFNFTVTQYLNGVAKAIESSPDIPAKEKESLLAQLKDIANSPYVANLATTAITEAMRVAMGL